MHWSFLFSKRTVRELTSYNEAIKIVKLRNAKLGMYFVDFIYNHTRDVDNPANFSKALPHTQLFCSLSNEIYLNYKLKTNQALMSI